MIDQMKQYLAERKKWTDAGKPMRTPEKMKQLHDICKECPLFKKAGGWPKKYDQCGECGCNLHPEEESLNKLAWATTHCPHPDGPKWGPEEEPEVDGDRFQPAQTAS